jgi:hypothetical protein
VSIRGDEDNSSTLVHVEHGSATFKAQSNIPGVEIREKSSMLSADIAVEGNMNGELFYIAGAG